jgi:mannose-6-phosphate isomerase
MNRCIELYPFAFDPIFKERIWGGRNLEKLYGKTLPPKKPFGESWEISDRPGDESIISNGPLRGRSLRWLMEQCPQDLLGPVNPTPKRFPLLIKILDACQTLSVQVHPPAAIATALGGEPKTEMWYVADAKPGAELYCGLKRGVTRSQFEQKLSAGDVEECIHRIPVSAGDAMWMPSGRIHALGGGVVVFEVQQNSDTTYRVFDWNRLDDQGKPRQLHVKESLASIDFKDFEPSLLPRAVKDTAAGRLRPMVKNNLFDVALRQLRGEETWKPRERRMRILGVTEGSLRVGEGRNAMLVQAGEFCLIPASCPGVPIAPRPAADFLEIKLGAG